MHEVKGNKTVAEAITKINLRINICKRKKKRNQAVILLRKIIDGS